MAYEDFDSRKWNRYIRALNNELEPENSGLALTKEEVEGYRESLLWLKEERKQHPGIPIGYSPVELDW